MRIPFITKAGPGPKLPKKPAETSDRADGEDAIANTEGELAEATPTGMPRLKTENL